MTTFWITLLLIGLIKLCAGQSGESRLLATLMARYNQEYRYTRPVMNDDDQLTVEIGMTLVDIFDFDRESGIGTFTVFQKMSWKDAHLTWDPRTYGGLKNLRFPSEKLWIPDFVVYNSQIMSPDRLDSYTVVDSDGKVLWVPRVKLTIRCQDTDDADFLCRFNAGSWTYHEGMINPERYNNESVVDTSAFVGGDFFEIVDTAVVREDKKYDCCPESYPVVNFDVKINYVGPTNSASVLSSSVLLVFAMVVAMMR